MASCRLQYCHRQARPKSMYCSVKCCSAYHQVRRRPSEESKRIRKDRDRARHNTTLGKYNSHKSKAASRGIQFRMSFDEWLGVWGNNLCNMGNSSDSLQMCRTGDTGAYEVGNVRIDTTANNMREALKLRRKASDN